ncbi:PREDICTED: zinc finger protein 524-like [Dinoponera quadriceps]|uniref:Zinc finger protein 524-like n=1 Tax=Dinoponera quadriceps TaxID=609295 RepID=A0A6P3XVY4_DINQU|nr:PREDICTED: zinc finger protein 524-like [Dinoponera quadriceps]
MPPSDDRAMTGRASEQVSYCLFLKNLISLPPSRPRRRWVLVAGTGTHRHMGALLSLLRSDYKQQHPPSTKKHRSSAPTVMTRSSIAITNRRASNSNAGDHNNYDEGSGGDGGGGSGGRSGASAREVVFPDSFEVLPQPHDLNAVYMGVPHEQQRKFRCRFCGKGYRWKSTMRRHEMVECGGKPPAFQCPECPYKARQRGNLTVHFKRHHQKIVYDESV